MHDTNNDTPIACLWEADGKTYTVGIVGTGPGFLSIVEVLSCEDYEEFLPPMRLVAVAEPKFNLNWVRTLRSRGVAVHESWAAMLDTHPDIDIVIDLTGSSATVRELRDALPPHVSLMDRGAAVFLCGLHSLFQAGAHTRSRLQSSEALLYAVAGQIREDIMLLDLRGRVEDMNIHVQTRTGAARHELIGKPCWNVQTLTQGTPFCRGPNRKCPFHTTLTTRAKAEALLTRVDPEGNLMYFRVYSYPIFGESGDMEHVMIMRRDITSRTRRERQLSQSEKLAVIGEMSMYLAHEIKNPLFAIGGFVHALMRSEAIVGKDREKLEIIQEECLRLDRILGSILSFARPSKDPSESVDLAAVVSQVAELMRIGYGKQNYEFDTRSDYPLPKVQGGADRIKQCLINILKNSMEAMPGGGKIVISTGTSGDMVALIVEDTGRGMSQSEMERAFSPFYTTKDQGSGLGLAMIKKIIEEFGGRVELHSREGHGTTVTLLFMPYLAERWAPGEALPANADAETMTPGPDIAPHRDHGADAKQ